MVANWRRWLLALGLAALTVTVRAAEPRARIVREETPIAKQTAELVIADLSRRGWNVTEAVIGPDGAPSETRFAGDTMLVALGSRALATLPKSIGGATAVAALVTRSALEEMPQSDRWSAIILDQPAERWANLIQLAFAGRMATAGLLLGAFNTKSMPLLQRKFQERQLTLVEERVVATDEVVPALDRLLPRVSVLLALPDPMVHNRATVQALLLTTYRAGVPVVAYSESYLQAGAVIALYSTASQISAQVVETLLQLREGRPAAAIQAPRYFTVGVNATVARSLGLPLPSGGELKERLRAAEQ